MKLRPSTKIGLGFVALATMTYFGYQAYAEMRVGRLNFAPVSPGNVNLVAVSLGSGLRIVVANRVAQLKRGDVGEFGAQSPGETSDADTGEGQTSRPIPIRDMLSAKQGDAKGLAKLVMSLAEIGEDKLPPDAPVWKAEEIQAALKADGPERTRLLRDVNVNLDGSAPDFVNLRALRSGILIDVPVPVNVGNPVGTVVARVKTPYMPRLMAAVERQIREKFNVTNAAVQGYYREEAIALQRDPSKRENVRQSLETIIGEASVRRFAQPAEQLLQAIHILVNESHLTGASMTTETTSQGKELSALTLQLSEEGRNRLWKFSRGRAGFQLLLTVDGIALSAPAISHELSGRSVRISNMPDKVLVQDAVARVKGLTDGGTQG